MRIKTENTLYGDKREYASLEEYAECRLDGDDYGTGAIEAAADTAANNSKAIGRLLGLLVDKGLIAPKEAAVVVEGYISGTIEFLES